MNLRMCFIVTRRNASRLLFIVILCYAVFFMYTYNGRHAMRLQKKEVAYLGHDGLKFILLWTNRFQYPIITIGMGINAFVKGNCNYTNCFVTDDRDYLIDQRDFDAVIFGGVNTGSLWFFQRPSVRSPKQKFIFAASESVDNYPVCSTMFNGYFNWTWTYKMDSDIFWGYISIYDLDNNLIGPSLNMKWLNKLNPINEDLKTKLANKSKTAAWFVSHCITNGGREGFVQELQKELRLYGRNVDIYGRCGTLSCPRDNEASCFKKIEEDYYFYLSFENSFAEDYVTEKLLNALNNYAVPIVYGSANYSRVYFLVGPIITMSRSDDRILGESRATLKFYRFLPPGSYLNALKLGPKELARQMDEIINDKSKYHDFFRWRNHYVYRETNALDEVCKLCTALNDEVKMAEVTVWDDFRTWWNGNTLRDKC